MDLDANWAATGIGISFLLTSLSHMSGFVRKYVPWFPRFSLVAGMFLILVGILWNNWDSLWFFIPFLCLILFSILLIMWTPRTDLVKIRFSHAVWNGINNSEPYIDFIFEIANISGSPITIIQASGWIEIDSSRCNTPPQTSRQNISSNDSRNIRIHQPITIQTSRLIQRRQAEFRFSTCKLVLESGAEVPIGGVRNLKVPRLLRS